MAYSIFYEQQKKLLSPSCKTSPAVEQMSSLCYIEQMPCYTFDLSTCYGIGYVLHHGLKTNANCFIVR